jgi:hypothetical protein
VLSGGTTLGGNRDAAGADDHTAGAEPRRTAVSADEEDDLRGRRC